MLNNLKTNRSCVTKLGNAKTIFNDRIKHFFHIVRLTRMPILTTQVVNTSTFQVSVIGKYTVIT